MDAHFEIGQCRHLSDNQRHVYSASIDGEEVRFAFNGDCEVPYIGAAYLGISLLEAMATGRSIHLDKSLPVPIGLISSLLTLQLIYCNWNPGLSVVGITADCEVDNPGRVGALCFYSAGVDSNYSLARHFEEVTHLVTLNSFEAADEASDWNQFKYQQREFSRRVGKELVEVEGDFGDFNRRRKISRLFQHGLDMGGIAAALGFVVSYIPSSFSASELFPWGSHPLTDPLWGGTERCVVHDGIEVRRSEKIAFLGAYPQLLDNLQVCWASVHDNCGRCSKCVRTLIALELLELHSARLPARPVDELMPLLKVNSETSAAFIRDLMLLAEESGNDFLARKLRGKLQRFALYDALVNLAKAAGLSGLVKRVRRYRPPAWASARVTLRDTNIG